MTTRRPEDFPIGDQENAIARLGTKISTVTVHETLSRGAFQEVGNKLKTSNTTSVAQKNNVNAVKPTSPQKSSVVCLQEVKSNPFLADEYVMDIFEYLRRLEVEFAVKENFLTDHATTPKMRTQLINWLVEVHEAFHLCLETLHICVLIIDRYLEKDRTIGKSNLQLVGVAALLISCKYEEVYIPDIKDFEYICEDQYPARVILRMEIDIMKTLEFNLGKPTSIQFLRRYNNVIQARREHHTLGKYLLELILVQHMLSHVPPSLQAAACCCLAIAIINEVMQVQQVWNSTMVQCSTYKYDDLRPLLIDLAQMIVNGERMISSVKKKYASSKYGRISLDPKLNGALVRKLANSSK